jgi:hypothetical membrane protein
VTAHTEDAVATTTTTARLLTIGAFAGPVFIVVAALQVLTRDGFDLRRLPLSALSLGDAGWVQIANFAVTGALMIVLAAGMRQMLRGGRSGTWGPLLVGVHGLGLLAAGVFVTDAGGGFPPGAPAAFPTELSWHATLHNLAAMTAFGSLAAACFVFVGRFAAVGAAAWAMYCVTTGAAALALFAWPGTKGISVRLAIGTVLTMAWTTAMALRLRAELDASGARSTNPE